MQKKYLWDGLILDFNREILCKYPEQLVFAYKIENHAYDFYIEFEDGSNNCYVFKDQLTEV